MKYGFLFGAGAMVFLRVEDLLWIFSDMTHQKVSKSSKICVERLILRQTMHISGFRLISEIKILVLLDVLYFRI